jgi:hypothetical protein
MKSEGRGQTRRTTDRKAKGKGDGYEQYSLFTKESVKVGKGWEVEKVRGRHEELTMVWRAPGKKGGST